MTHSTKYATVLGTFNFVILFLFVAKTNKQKLIFTDSWDIYVQAIDHVDS